MRPPEVRVGTSDRARRGEVPRADAEQRFPSGDLDRLVPQQHAVDGERRLDGAIDEAFPGADPARADQLGDDERPDEHRGTDHDAGARTEHPRGDDGGHEDRRQQEDHRPRAGDDDDRHEDDRRHSCTDAGCNALDLRHEQEGSDGGRPVEGSRGVRVPQGSLRGATAEHPRGIDGDQQEPPGHEGCQGSCRPPESHAPRHTDGETRRHDQEHARRRGDACRCSRDRRPHRCHAEHQHARPHPPDLRRRHRPRAVHVRPPTSVAVLRSGATRAVLPTWVDPGGLRQRRTRYIGYSRTR